MTTKEVLFNRDRENEYIPIRTGEFLRQYWKEKLKYQYCASQQVPEIKEGYGRIHGCYDISNGIRFIYDNFKKYWKLGYLFSVPNIWYCITDTALAGMT